MLKVSPWKGVVRFGKRGKLYPRYVGPFKVLKKVGTVAYKLNLVEELIKIMDREVKQLRRSRVPMTSLSFSWEDFQVDENLHFVEELLKIMDSWKSKQ
ncbi:hypothetical protein Tco_0140993 [Tanacetum coccineum]